MICFYIIVGIKDPAAEIILTLSTVWNSIFIVLIRILGNDDGRFFIDRFIIISPNQISLKNKIETSFQDNQYNHTIHLIIEIYPIHISFAANWPKYSYTWTSSWLQFMV